MIYLPVTQIFKEALLNKHIFKRDFQQIISSDQSQNKNYIHIYIT